MVWPVDEVRWQRVRDAMAEADLDALVVRAPDNIHYLTNYWAMKAWEIAIFPREGSPTLLAVEPQALNVRRNAWTDDIVFFKGFNPDDARPSFLRALDKAIGVLKDRGLTRRIGVETSNAVQSPERMTGEPTVYWKGYFDDLEAAIVEVATRLGRSSQRTCCSTRWRSRDQPAIGPSLPGPSAGPDSAPKRSG